VIPTTDRIWIVRNGERATIRNDNGSYETLLRSELLQNMNLADTPGLNSSTRDDAWTTSFIPQCDVVLFVVSAKDALRATEKQFLQKLYDSGANVAIVTNKSDLLVTTQEQQRVSKIQRECKEIIPTVRVFTVSAMTGFGMDHLTAFMERICASNYTSFLRVNEALLSAKELVSFNLKQKRDRREELNQSLERWGKVKKSIAEDKRQVCEYTGAQIGQIKALFTTLERNSIAFMEANPRKPQEDFQRLIAKVFVQGVQSIIQKIIDRLNTFVKLQNSRFDENVYQEDSNSKNCASNAESNEIMLKNKQNELNEFVQKGHDCSVDLVKEFYGASASIMGIFSYGKNETDTVHEQLKPRLTDLSNDMEDMLEQQVTSTVYNQEQRVQNQISINATSMQKNRSGNKNYGKCFTQH